MLKQRKVESFKAFANGGDDTHSTFESP